VLYEKRNMNNEKKMIWNQSISILKNYPGKRSYAEGVCAQGSEKRRFEPRGRKQYDSDGISK
jgi:hypothetical protein